MLGLSRTACSRALASGEMIVSSFPQRRYKHCSVNTWIWGHWRAWYFPANHWGKGKLLKSFAYSLLFLDITTDMLYAILFTKPKKKKKPRTNKRKPTSGKFRNFGLCGIFRSYQRKGKGHIFVRTLKHLRFILKFCFLLCKSKTSLDFALGTGCYLSITVMVLRF